MPSFTNVVRSGFTEIPELGIKLFSPVLRAQADAASHDSSNTYWSHPFPTGRLIANHIFANPDEVVGQTVADLGVGCGLVSIVAAKVGAKHVIAADSNPDALKAAYFNASINCVGIETVLEKDIAGAVDIFAKADILIAADVFYGLTARDLEKNLLAFAERGKIVYMGTPPMYYAFPGLRNYAMHKKGLFKDDGLVLSENPHIVKVFRADHPQLNRAPRLHRQEL